MTPEKAKRKGSEVESSKAYVLNMNISFEKLSVSELE